MHKNRPISANRLVIPFEKNDNGVGVIDVSDKNVGLTAPRPVSAVGRSNKNVGRSATADGNVARDARRLSTLLEVSQALSGTLNLKSSMQRVLADPHAITASSAAWSRCCATASCTSRRSRASRIARATVRYQVGEGITGKVVESGKPIVVPRVSKEPAFLNRAAAPPRAAAPGAELHLRADPAEPPGGRRARRRSQVQARARLRQQRQVLRHRQRR